ncbi:G-type lectin S-receptor-like serine/threonine-protein kinase At1g11410 [Punica granatum]|uniref:Receptor-like serine/threonine-protein kinase n=1 Tax=Punica granatum TaxID=22663 RepID=A0A6P8DZ57_PUNGR|nr:G-type lectin S-receptor-like serine/threonine-protein kinase At1g11410 [Punica granatum]
MDVPPLVLLLCLHTLLLLLHHTNCKTLNTISQTIPLHDGDVLLSENKNFALGFFSPGNSTRRFIGTWYNKVSEPTVFWVANRDRPINDTSGVLSINSHGDLVLHCCNNGSSTIWSTNVSTTSSDNATTAQLRDTGNLNLLQRLGNRVMWQSFDHPSDTLMPFMKLGQDPITGMDWVLTSWRSEDDPGSGNFTFRIDFMGYPQLFLYKNGAPRWRGGPWTGLRWSGMPRMTNNYIVDISFENNQKEFSILYGLRNTSTISRMVVESSGMICRFIWHAGDGQWNELWTAPVHECDYYKACGPNSNCNPYNADQFICTCLPGFEPQTPADWLLRDGSGGCIRSLGASTCQSGEGFVKVALVKVPDTSRAYVNMSMSLKECERECLKNCSCTAYASADERQGGTGCLAWYGDLLDIRTFSNTGQELYVRVDAAILARLTKKDRSPRKWLIGVTLLASVILAFLVVLFMMKKRHWRTKPSATPSAAHFGDDESRNMQDIEYDSRTSDLPFFDLSTIATATNNFSFINKLGKGGFGSVYKGVLDNGMEIAVKRLSKSSGQGTKEFKNEVTLIAKLQHRNLVKILGCCIQGDEKMLIYEYLPNKSLDSFLFNEEKKSLLDWRKRFEIAMGIARGILYLHQDSRLRIIHRDLKASNVLLDASMNPKISDFGMARICGGDQVEGNTRRVVGTYGYMSPEYAMEGLFSIKSDVYSFGVLLLEIISGKRNSSFYQENSTSNIIGHVWELWNEESCLDIVDPSMDIMYPEHEVLRCIQISLLCVQEFPMDRPTMSTVVFMLGNSTRLPSPKQPAFAFKRTQGRADASSSGERTNSINDMSLTVVEAR